ncbi:MAG: hypothetical protein RL139_476, partial [Gemmatimonadota bacterium]
FCSSSWLPELRPVKSSSAKDQKLSTLNPAQISGSCGRLMCCLRYEHEFYVQSRKRFPKEGKVLTTAIGEEKVVSNDIFRDLVTLRTAGGEARTIPLAQLRHELGEAPLPVDEETVADGDDREERDDEPMVSLTRAPRAAAQPAPTAPRSPAERAPAPRPSAQRPSAQRPSAQRPAADRRPAPPAPSPAPAPQGATGAPAPSAADGDAARRGKRRRGRRGGRRGKGGDGTPGTAPGGSAPSAD